MNVRNCIRCGKIFNYVTGKPICQNCRQGLEEKFKETKLYIKRNHMATIAEVSEACEVEVKQIKEWIREERLSFSEDSAIGLDCEACGTTIKTGRFCDNCKSTMTQELKNAYKQERPKQDNPFAKEKTAKMRFMDDNKRR